MYLGVHVPVQQVQVKHSNALYPCLRNCREAPVLKSVVHSRSHERLHLQDSCSFSQFSV